MKSIIIVNLIVVVSGAAPGFLQDGGDAPIKPAQAEVSEEFSDPTTPNPPAVPATGTPVDAKSERELPDWYKDGVNGSTSKSGDVSFLVFSTPSVSTEESDSELKEKLVSEVITYIDENILKHVSHNDVNGLTKDYVQNSILSVNAARLFHKEDQHAGGPMFTSVRQVTIEKRELDRIKGWESQLIVGKRSQEVGLIGGIGLAGMTFLSALIGLLARREKAKLKG